MKGWRPGRLLAAGLVLLSLAGRVGGAEAPWRQLPPTPALPETATSGSIELNGVSIWHAEFGAGDPVILLHGGLANADYWGHLVPFLVRHGFRVIVMDSRGHGRSTRDAAPYSYHLMAGDVLALMDALAIDQADLVGWSDGGIIGLDIAMHHPQRLKHLFAFGANTDPSGMREDVGQSPVFMAFNDRTAREYRKLSPTPGQYDAFLAQIMHMWETQPHWTDADLARISVPVTVADGAHDEAIKQAHDRYMARAIPNARLVILDDASHFAMLQRPAAFNAAVLKALRP